jgi:excisionase family DNA binding protein
MPLPQFLTTKEVANLLRIKERKVYELATDGAIPVSRVTGKLLFPRDLVEMWVQQHVEYLGGRESLREHPAVLAGSHDPLLEWALRESASGIATFLDGSLDGVQRLAAGAALAAGLHVQDAATGEWNRDVVAAALPGMPVVMIEWARRRQGIVLPQGNPARVEGIRDLVGRSVIPRQPNAGSQLLFEQLLEAEAIDPQSIALTGTAARSETDVAVAVADGKAEAGFAIEAAARQLRLAFIPLAEERYDLAVWRRDYFEEPMQRLLKFARSALLAKRAEELGGYDVSNLGKVHYNGP